MQKIDGKSLDIGVGNVEKLREAFPQVFEDGKVNFEKLKALIGENDVAQLGEESYNFSWVGKADSFREIQKQSTKTLVPDRDSSVDFDKSKNIYIEGENLEVLRVLQKSYYDKVKMIYIDPPYNTGKDSFVYPDDYSERKIDYEKRAGVVDDDGFVNKVDLWKKNTKESGQFHSVWLSMMYPRLYLARNLLRKDGVIFISIDDNEVDNLKKICDEVFGEENFIASVIWKRKRGRDNSAKWFSKSHEYLLVYSKNKEVFNTNLLDLDDGTKEAYKNPDNDPRGNYRMLGVWARGTQGGVAYDFTAKNGQYFSERLWLMSKDSLCRLDCEDKLIFRGDNIYRKLFIIENKGKIPETIWDSVSNAANASDEIKNLFGDILFDTSKPVPYLSETLKISTNSDSNDIVLDFFSGSATTAHAVMEMNKQDGGNRQYILVQLPENCDEKSEAFKAGYKTIAEIGKERIRRVIKKIKSEQKDAEKKSAGELDLGDKAESKPLDLGFKSFTLKPSNFKIWNTDVDNAEDLTKQMEMFVKPLTREGINESILFELMLKSGIMLDSEIKTHTVGAAKYFIADNIAFLMEKADEPLIDDVIKHAPRKVICLDSIFDGNDQLKSNTALRFKDASIDFMSV